ncbi:MAG: hypothetical protein JJU06_19140 [Ectothiorhodospiraceae bacterium]|nr:hypothetical protein [Ectothiorhodospiraceae bacterium]MCH8503551.1 DUF6489 family protein [Ectothiorhodospiraceae bacterium]
MKIKVDLEATPEELRRFLGLPDVQRLQDELMEQLRKRMLEGQEGYDPLSLVRPMLPGHLQGMEALQKAFMQAMTQGMSMPSSETDRKSDKTSGK